MDRGFNDRIGDLVIGPDNLLTVVLMFQDPENTGDYYRSIHKYNEEMVEVWNWTREILPSRTGFHGFTLAILDDGRMVHTNGRQTWKNRESVSIRAIDEDGGESWYYDFPIWTTSTPVDSFFIYELLHLIRTENNEIVGCGWYEDRPNYKGYLFRMSSEGEMLWERYYYTDSIDYYGSEGKERISGGIFHDVEELENGDLAVVGEKHTRTQREDGSWYTEEDLWFLRLDAHGCKGDYCRENRNTTIIASTNEEDVKEGISINPNPVEHLGKVVVKENMALTLWSSDGIRKGSYDLQGGENVLDVSHLAPGIYFCSGYSELSKKGYKAKLVKM